MQIVSKRHPYTFYLTLILITFFCLGIAGLILFSSFKGDNKGYLISFVILTLIIYVNYLFIKHSSTITLNKSGIFRRGHFYDWKDIQEIKLTGKSGFFLNFPTECAVLTFNTGKPIELFDSLYWNAPEMKYFIQEVVINKKESIDKQHSATDFKNLDRELFIPYKGHPVFSFRGILMWGLILFMLLMPFYLKPKPHWDISFLFLFGFSLFWFVFNSAMMNFFEISKNYFVVKNHYFFWKKRIYPISEIKEVVYEQQGKQPNCVRVITNRFSTKLYMAGSLTDSTFLEMKKELESKNIVVRNECIY